MANSLNLSYSGQGPSASGQVLADGVMPGLASSNIDAYGIFTGDNATATATVNYIDGTATLPFVPSAVVVTRSGGAASLATTIQGVSAITNTGFTVTFSGNVPAATYGLAVRIVR